MSGTAALNAFGAPEHPFAPREFTVKRGHGLRQIGALVLKENREDAGEDDEPVAGPIAIAVDVDEPEAASADNSTP